MIDLHLHLDGSLDVQTILKLAKECDIVLPGSNARELKPYICAAKRGGNLDSYLNCFELPISLLQTKDALRYASRKLIKRLDNNKMCYAEIRFAPQLHTQNYLSQAEVVEAVIEGINEGCEISKNMKANLILCCMRGESNENENLETLNVAKYFLGSGVCALDLAGAEATYKTGNYKKLFELSSRYDIPFTIHAGEADGAQSVREAIEMGAKRIGHGVRVCEDDEVLEMVISHGIALEMCPTSNVQTGAVSKIKEYPIRRLLKMGAIVTVNTDNMTVSDTDIKKEYTLLKNSLSLTAEEEKMLLLNAVYAAFLPEEDKQILSENIYLHGLYI